MNIKNTAAAILILVIPANFMPRILAQEPVADATFGEIKLMQNDGKKFRQRSADLTFRAEDLFIEVPKGTDVVIRYDEIVTAEYSYSKNPRWKTGLGLTAAGILFPPLWLVSIPLGFTKHRRHWLTIKTKEDFAVLKMSKSNRKLLIPTFEIRTGITVEAIGEDK